MNRTTFIILLFFFSTTYGQKIISFNNFVKLFPETTLPAYINYSESEFKTEYYKPDNAKATDAGIPYHDHVLPKDSSLIIKYELVKLFLLADSEVVTPRYPDNTASADTIYPTYYISARLNTNKNFVCLIYERQFNIGSGDRCSDKILCTFTKIGKLIDKVLIASAYYSGTGMLDQGFRVPWFPETHSNIYKDLSILLKDGNYGDLNYQIDDNGNIIKTKAGQ